MQYDLAVIGGGIVGLATALRYIERNPSHRVVVIEKEAALAQHQSGHNSGVIHAGVYYAPGSLKAQLCRRGALLMKEFCTKEGIPFETLGKLIVATSEVEVARLADLRIRAEANAIPYSPLNAEELALREPHISGLSALFFPESAIVDYAEVTRRMGARFEALGGRIALKTKITAIRETAEAVTLEDHTGGQVTSGHLIVCGGAQADRLAKMAGLKCDFRVVPFRGEYHQLDPKIRGKLSHLIYPVPDPALPFLGIHLTQEMVGQISMGPNAVLGLSREGLPRFSLSLRDMAATFGYIGFWRFMRKNLGSGLSELGHSLFRRRYLAACQKYMPSLSLADFRGRKAGVRAQIIMQDGTIMHDFLVLKSKRMTHVCAAPSPAATSSLAIADHLLDGMAKS